MFKKINNIIFILLFLAVLVVPLLFTRWESGGVSQVENRNLAAFPALTKEGAFNLSFTQEFETWFMDHLGFRQMLIDSNKALMEQVFQRNLTTSDVKTGKTGDLIYAPDAVIKDFAHANLRTADQVAEIGNSYQAISDYLEGKGIPFYYVQCVDKHTIYPERFIPHVKQLGDTSKTDQVMHYLETQTTVKSIYLKTPLLAAKEAYPVFSHWGDSTHWSDRGAYIAYCHIMEQLNRDMDQPLKILTEADYEITFKTNYGTDGNTEQEEQFTVKDPKATKSDKTIMGKWSEDDRHSRFVNPEAGNNKKLLLMGDSYINSFIIRDIAESFGEVWLVWGDYTADLSQIVDLYQPDLVIYECAERVDRSKAVCALADSLK